MASLADAEDELRSTNCKACAENEQRIVSLASKQPTESHLDELQHLRAMSEDLIRLKTEYSVCKDVTENFLEDLRKLRASAKKDKVKLRKELEESKQAIKRHLEELKELRETAEKDKDELWRELEATKRHLEEQKELRASAEKDKDELRKELHDSKQATKRHLEDLEQLRASIEKNTDDPSRKMKNSTQTTEMNEELEKLRAIKNDSEHEEDRKPSERPQFGCLGGIFSSTKSKTKKKKKSSCDEATEHQIEGPKLQNQGTPENTGNDSDSEEDVFARSSSLKARNTMLHSSRIGYASTSYGNCIDVRAEENVNVNMADGSGDRVSLHSLSLVLVKSKLSSRLSSKDSSVSLDAFKDEDEEKGDVAEAGSGKWKRIPSASSFTEFAESLKRKMSTKRDETLLHNEQQDTDRARGTITILEEPPPQQEAKEGSKVELVFKCKSRDTSKLFYQWFKDNTELQGKNESILLLKSVALPDFGCYRCRAGCKDSPSDVVESISTELDVTPRDGTRYKNLNEIDPNTQDRIGTLLTQKRHGLGGWRQIAFKYWMDQLNIKALQDDPEAGSKTLEYLESHSPYLTVYEFCKTLKEYYIRRLDIVKELLGHLSVAS